MSNKLIMCEGPTDAILLSYYIINVCGWKYSKSHPEGINIKEEDNTSVNWYLKNNDYLLICGVGGKDNFGNFFDQKIKNTVFLSNSFDKIVAIRDKDYDEICDIESSLSSLSTNYIQKFRNKQWEVNYYIDSYGATKKIDSLLIVIPNSDSGALENVMLESISEDEDKKIIVDKSKRFVTDIRNLNSIFIDSDRIQLKANLSVTLSILYPEKTFCLIDELVNGVQWEKYETINSCFSILKQL